VLRLLNYGVLAVPVQKCAAAVATVFQAIPEPISEKHLMSQPHLACAVGQGVHQLVINCVIQVEVAVQLHVLLTPIITLFWMPPVVLADIPCVQPVQLYIAVWYLVGFNIL
jgi:hypothetical protein